MYDNRSTYRREYWINGKVEAFVDAIYYFTVPPKILASMIRSRGWLMPWGFYPEVSDGD